MSCDSRHQLVRPGSFAPETIRLNNRFPISSSKSHRLIEVLKATLLQVESSTEWNQDDHAVVELKRILQRRIDQESAALDDEEIVG